MLSNDINMEYIKSPPLSPEEDPPFSTSSSTSSIINDPLFKTMPPLQRMPMFKPPSVLASNSFAIDTLTFSERFPRFIEGKYNMKKSGKWILARNKTSTLRISATPCSGTYAVGIVHGSPDYFTQKITQLQHKNPKGIHPKKKDFTRGDEPVFSIWTDRTAKPTVTFMDLSVGKYKAVKMAIVHLVNERDMYVNFNTESTALCLESLGQLWNLVVLELTETEDNYEAGFKEIDRMEETKIPIKVVSVLRRNMISASDTKKLASSNGLLQEVNKQLQDMNQSELLEMYHCAMQVKAKRITLEIT